MHLEVAAFPWGNELLEQLRSDGLKGLNERTADAADDADLSEDVWRQSLIALVALRGVRLGRVWSLYKIREGGADHRWAVREMRDERWVVEMKELMGRGKRDRLEKAMGGDKGKGVLREVGRMPAGRVESFCRPDPTHFLPPKRRITRRSWDLIDPRYRRRGVWDNERGTYIYWENRLQQIGHERGIENIQMEDSTMEDDRDSQWRLSDDSSEEGNIPTLSSHDEQEILDSVHNSSTSSPTSESGDDQIAEADLLSSEEDGGFIAEDETEGEEEVIADTPGSGDNTTRVQKLHREVQRRPIHVLNGAQWRPVRVLNRFELARLARLERRDEEPPIV